MVDAVVFGDIVGQATAYLQSALAARPEAYTDGVTVTNRYLGNLPARQVVISRDGGGRDGLLESPRLRTNVWAAFEEDATDLASMVSALLMAWPDGDPVVGIRQLSGPSELDEPADDRFRRFMLHELKVRGVQLTPAS